MRPRRYSVTARQFPIVYTLEGDHDRDGLLYSLRCYGPLLDWAREQWDADGEWFPLAYQRAQRIRMLLDALWRYGEMVERLEAGPERYRYLLDYLGGDDPEGGNEDERRERPRSEVEQHFRATVDEIAIVLSDLTDREIREVSPGPAVRAAWAARWREALEVLDAALEQRLKQIAQSWNAERSRLARQSGLSVDRLERLIFNDHSDPKAARAGEVTKYDRFHPLKPIPVVRPLVLRARRGETVEIEFENQIRDRRVGLHRAGAGLGGEHGEGVKYGDGAAVGKNPDTTVVPGKSRVYVWQTPVEGVFPVNDLADVRGSQAGTNMHGLFGALIVEPEGARWRDPETGEDLTEADYGDGLYVDVLPAGENIDQRAHRVFVDFHQDHVPRSFREFTVFFHDEPAVHGALHVGPAQHSAMPLSYRAEPMPNRAPHRLRLLAAATPPFPPPGQIGNDLHAVKIEINDNLAEVFWVGRRPNGSWIERVSGEEQHHSSWLFGDPVTPVLRAYRGDPARIRLVHGGVKETHVFHLHVHQWHETPADTAAPSTWRPGEPRGSRLIDSITLGPQDGMTLDPLYGSGSRQHAFGDIIWHCHLYPHFHHGMWGIWRSFERAVDGNKPLPDGTPCPRLVALPGREPPAPDDDHPGFPWFINAAYPQKSPPPPAVLPKQVGGRRRLLDLPPASELEENAFDPGAAAKAEPGAVFVDLDGVAGQWNSEAGLAPPRVLSYDLDVRTERIDYNSIGWHDKHGHFFQLTAVHVTEPSREPQRELLPLAGDGREPLWLRANHGDIIEFRLHNQLGTVPADDFDLTQLPVECGLHVHMVKFDVLAADGSSTGWNYLSGASSPEVLGAVHSSDNPGNISLHRWVVDEEFGPCFFHDHLLANYRQKRGLFGALHAQPPGSTWARPRDPDSTAWTGGAAVIDPRRGPTGLSPYREASFAIGDFISSTTIATGR